MDVTIVIPVKNGGPLFAEVLRMVFRQKTEYTYEVICVDSGSVDDSVRIAREAGCRVYEIPSEEFGHGRTRNYGASLGTGEFICFLTQDATPASEDWLQQIIDAMRSDPEIAGGFGIHYPYPDCNLPDQLMLRDHFARFGTKNRIFQLTEENHLQYEQDQGYREYLTFFSDNNACLRRSVWEKIPYDDVDYAEDQFWARKILESGYKKVYCPGAGVYHSHNYPLRSYGKRYYDDFKALYRVFHMVLCPDPITYLRGILGDTKRECIYILGRKDQTFGKKCYWCYYSFRRNISRRTASVRAVKYYSMTEEKQKQMDAKYSMEYSRS